MVIFMKMQLKNGEIIDIKSREDFDKYFPDSENKAAEAINALYLGFISKQEYYDIMRQTMREHDGDSLNMPKKFGF